MKTKFTLCTVALSFLALFSFVSATYAEQSFRVKVNAGVTAVGSTGTIFVLIKPKKGFKPNEEYPNKISHLTAKAKNVGLPSTKIKGSLVGNTIEFRVPVIPKKKGKHSVKGEIRFSVCTDKVCHVKKIPLISSITGT